MSKNLWQKTIPVKTKISMQKKVIFGITLLCGLLVITAFGLGIGSSLNSLVGSGRGTSPTFDRSVRHKVVPDQILVKFKASASKAKRNEVLARHNFKQKDEIKQIDVKILSLPPGLTPQEAIQRLKDQDQDSLEFAEPDAIIEPAAFPNDPFYKLQWHLPKIQAPQAWNLTTGSSSVIIAILDSGVDATHPDLAAHIVPGWNIVDNNADTSDVGTKSHGTAAAGAAAAVINNGVGLASPCGNCRIMPVRVGFSGSGQSTSAKLAIGLVWAAGNGARVANVSYSYGGNDSSISSAAQYFMSKGGVVIWASGNDGTYLSFPDNPFIVATGASNLTDNLAPYSTRGTFVDLAAPGAFISVTTRGGGYSLWSGTSFSAPIVAGIAGLIYSANPNLNGGQVTEILKQSANDLGPTGWDPGYGFGRVNAYRAVQVALGQLTLPSIEKLDILPPTVSITSPLAGANVAGSLEIQLNIKDDVSGVVKTEFYVNGQLKSYFTSYISSIYWNTATYPNGPANLEIRVYDGTGKIGSAKETIQIRN